MKNHPLRKYLKPIKEGHAIVAKNLKYSRLGAYFHNFDNFVSVCGKHFLANMSRLNSLHVRAFGKSIPASLAAAILADYYGINLKDSLNVLAGAGCCTPDLYQILLDRLAEKKTGIETAIMLSRTEAQKLAHKLKGAK